MPGSPRRSARGTRRPGLPVSPTATRRTVTGVAVLAAWLILLVGCRSGEVATVRPAGPASSPTDDPEVAVALPASSSSAPTPEPSEPESRPVRTVRVAGLAIPGIDLATGALETLAVQHDGTLAAPHDPDRPGWYADGPVPGELGPAVIAGHLDSTTGPAVFARLPELRPGDTVTVRLETTVRSTRRDGASNRTTTRTTTRKVRFVVDRRITVAKDTFPSDEVYGPTPDAELRLITCGGAYDRHTGYTDNTVVFASLRTGSTGGGS